MFLWQFPLHFRKDRTADFPGFFGDKTYNRWFSWILAPKRTTADFPGFWRENVRRCSSCSRTAHSLSENRLDLVQLLQGGPLPVNMRRPGNWEPRPIHQRWITGAAASARRGTGGRRAVSGGERGLAHQAVRGPAPLHHRVPHRVVGVGCPAHYLGSLLVEKMRVTFRNRCTDKNRAITFWDHTNWWSKPITCQ